MGSGLESDMTSDAIGAALDDVLASDAFRDSPQLKAFLRYVVSETLAGRGDEIKGYSIATLALGRPESFDPQTDPIVRVQAGRVRQALAEYYQATPSAPIRIELERGAYAPRFRRGGGGPNLAPTGSSDAAITLPAVAQASTRRRFTWPAIAVVLLLAAVAGIHFAGQRQGAPPPISAASSAESFYPTLLVEADPASSYPGVGTMAARLREALARFDDLVVVAEVEAADMTASLRTTTNRPPGRDLMLRVTGHPAGDDRVRFGARLLDRRDNRVVWSREFDPFPAGVGGEGPRISIIRYVATIVAQPYGVIHAHVRARMEGVMQAADPYGCLVASFDYWQANDRGTHAAARQCIVERLKVHPSNAPLLAQLAYLHLEEFRHGYNPLPGDPLARALDSAQTAVRLAPASARSHQALLAALFSRRDLEGAWRAADEALRLNPYDTDVMADVGARHVQAGRFERGLGMLREASALNPAPPVWARTYEAIALYMLNRIDESGIIAAQLESTRYPPAIVATLLVAYHRRDLPKAKERLALLRSAHPTAAADFAGYLNRLNVSDLLLERSVASFNAAVAWTDGQ